jgi:hypothetical protein
MLAQHPSQFDRPQNLPQGSLSSEQAAAIDALVESVLSERKPVKPLGQNPGRPE